MNIRQIPTRPSIRYSNPYIVEIDHGLETLHICEAQQHHSASHLWQWSLHPPQVMTEVEYVTVWRILGKVSLDTVAPVVISAAIDGEGCGGGVGPLGRNPYTVVILPGYSPTSQIPKWSHSSWPFNHLPDTRNGRWFYPYCRQP